MLTIVRNKLELTIEDTTIGARGSAYLPVTLKDDGTYSDYIQQLHCRWLTEEKPKEKILEKEDDHWVIPQEAFQFANIISFSVGLVKDNEIIKTGEITIKIRNAPDGQFVFSTERLTWQKLVDDYSNDLFNKFKKSDIEPLKKEIQNDINQANQRYTELEGQIEEDINEANQHYAELKAKADEQEQRITQQQKSIESSVTESKSIMEQTKQATKSANDLVADVQGKLAKGEFKGDKGDIGPKGPTTLHKDEAIVERLDLKTTRKKADDSKVIVQLQDINNNVVYLEASSQNVYLTNDDGQEVTLDSYIKDVSDFVNHVEFFTSDYNFTSKNNLIKFTKKG